MNSNLTIGSNGTRASWRRAAARCAWLLLVVIIFLASANTAHGEDRTSDGSGNNIDNPTWGSASTELLRQAPADYADPVSKPAGANRPSARAISNAVCAQDNRIEFNDRDLTDWIWQWGQFVDHDISLTGAMSPAEPFNVDVPVGDPYFDPNSEGGKKILLNRSVYQLGSVPRQQLNQITAYIDGSGVYGSDADRAAWLRTFEGGKLKTSDGDLLPFSDGTQVSAGPGGAPAYDTTLFTAGDVRANEQVGLTAVHTLLVREHNRLCDELAAEHPDWTDEEIYQRARKVVGALIQVVTYNEFLPALLGPYAPDPADAKYDPSINAQIANEFSSACYRIGHTMLSRWTLRLNEKGEHLPEGPVLLRDAYFNPSLITDEGGVEPLLMGLAAQHMQEVDRRMIDDARNFLFAGPGEGGFDLAALNIQRGRDHGLADYNTAREAYGLERVESFEDISTDAEVTEQLALMYDGVDDIDLWVGALAEDHLDDCSAGKLTMTVLVEQFTRLRDGDRFFYRNDSDFSAEEVAELEATTLGDIIRRNTNLIDIPEHVFVLKATQPSDDDDDTGNGSTGNMGLCGAIGGISLAAMFLALSAFRFMTMTTRRRRRLRLG